MMQSLLGACGTVYGDRWRPTSPPTRPISDFLGHPRYQTTSHASLFLSILRFLFFTSSESGSTPLAGFGRGGHNICGQMVDPLTVNSIHLSFSALTRFLSLSLPLAIIFCFSVPSISLVLQNHETWLFAHTSTSPFHPLCCVPHVPAATRSKKRPWGTLHPNSFSSSVSQTQRSFPYDEADRFIPFCRHVVFNCESVANCSVLS